MKYKYQLHTHTAPTSKCAVTSPAELAEALYRAGYSGADTHTPDDVGCGGICTDERIRDGKDLVEVLRSGRYSLLKPQCKIENSNVKCKIRNAEG